jgi:two-component system, NarL family, invasion response regulator UvrY
VLVVDDRAPFRGAARAVVECTEGFVWVGEAETGEEAIDVAATSRPDLVLMDVNLPGMNGCDAARAIHARLPGTVVFLLSTYAAADLPYGPQECGAAAYLPKEQFSPAALAELWHDHIPPRAA